ncbi:PQQ-binding-like beta-propeller repeat protein [Thermodesulfobacteriota bacterium]
MEHHSSFLKLCTSFIILFIGFMLFRIVNVSAAENTYNPTIALADRLNEGQPKTKWEIIVDYEAADFISFIGNDRVLVGSVQSGSKLGIPKYGNIMLYNPHTGKRIWSASRPNIRKGEYALLTTEPVILLMAKDSKKTIFQAYASEQGKKKWSLKVTSPDQFVLPSSLDRMYSLVQDKTGKKDRILQAVDLTTGKAIWKQTLPASLFSVGNSEILFIGENDLYAGGKQISRIDGKTGNIVWKKSVSTLNAEDRQVNFTPLGIMVYNSGENALLNNKDGSVLWNTTSNREIIQFVTVLDTYIFRVVSGEKLSSGYNVQALHQKTGKVLWSAPVKKSIMSPLILENNSLIFTTDDEIIALRVIDGKQLFRKPLSEHFISKRPSLQKFIKQPDTIHYRSGTVYIAREMAGITAFVLPSGRKLWEQSVFNLADNTYSADRLYGVMARDLPMNDQPVSSGFSPGQSSASNAPSPFIRSAQRRYESEKQRNASILRKSGLTKAESQAAHQSNAMNARLMAANQRVDMAMGQMQAAGDLFSAVVGLQGAIKKAMEIATIQGVISRKYLELQSYMTLAQSGFQGKYFIWPFKDEGRGVTMVDLASGKRFDIRYSPGILPLEIFGIDLAKFALSPDRKSLVMVGIGMDSSKYKKQSKWNFTLPKPSVLSYDISTFHFQKKSMLQIKAEQKAIEEKRQAELIAKQTAEIFKKTQIFTVAMVGNIDKMKEMLDSGVDVNTKHFNDTCGPLIFAIIGGQTKMVQFLIERGADVNDKSKEGKSTLFWARQFGNKEIEKLLLAAGAK